MAYPIQFDRAPWLSPSCNGRDGNSVKRLGLAVEMKAGGRIANSTGIARTYNWGEIDVSVLKAERPLLGD